VKLFLCFFLNIGIAAIARWPAFGISSELVEEE
jgi:hypothetical protein